MVVEDDGPQLAYLDRQVTRYGYDSIPFASGDQALRANERPEALVAIIADIYLGGVADGIEVVRQIRERTGRIAALIITGYPVHTTAAFTRFHRLGTGVWFAEKPLGGKVVGVFLEIATIFESLGDAGTNELAVVVYEVGRRAKLTKPERALAPLIVRGVNRGEMARHIGISANTVQSQIRRVLRKAAIGLGEPRSFPNTRALRNRMLELARMRASRALDSDDLLPMG
jgi:FixJ family two-component response regulator